MLTSFIAFIFVIGVLVFVHELGHFLAARRIGVRVLTFSLGFGPKVAKFRRGDTEYCISAIPLGGYVKMAGENPDDQRTGADDESGVLAGQEPLRRAYCCCLCTQCATAASAVCAWARCSCWRRVWVVVRLLAFGTVHVMVLGWSLETLRVAGRCRGPRNGKLPTASARPLYDDMAGQFGLALGIRIRPKICLINAAFHM